jgi:hypothetical protein
MYAAGNLTQDSIKEFAAKYMQAFAAWVEKNQPN